MALLVLLVGVGFAVAAYLVYGRSMTTLVIAGAELVLGLLVAITIRTR